MGLPRNNRLIGNARKLKHNMTHAERRLWFGFLQSYPFPFVCQKIIGSYVVDFFCRRARISIELDGESHYEERQQKYDRIRTTFLEMLEIKELRFTNNDIRFNFEGVCEAIHREIELQRNDKTLLSLKELQRKM